MTPQNRNLIHATVTPLASIFGSGFLVIVPILAGSVGEYAIFAMAVICAIAYAVGSIVRFNIKMAEPILAENPTHSLKLLEQASNFAIVLAYIISVCLYLNIMAAFVLGGLHIDSVLYENIFTTSILAFITVFAVPAG